MPHQPSRRELICDAALDLAAEGGNHAVTHSAVDTRLGIAKGSTSYYFRTRSALIGAAIAHLTSTSRAAFDEMAPRSGAGVSVESASAIIAAYLDELLTRRRRDLLARYALAADAAADPTLRPLLARCLFSSDAATSLMNALGAGRSASDVDDPAEVAADLISLLEGLCFDATYGPRSLDATSPPITLLQNIIHRWLTATVS